MRSVIDAVVKLLQQVLRSQQRAATNKTPSRRSARRRPKGPVAAPDQQRPPARTEAVDAGIQIEYSPSLDGDPDPGEVVWTWVPYEEDPTQGKDRPVVIIGRSGASLLGVALTSKQHDNEAQVEVGTGPWDGQGRPSYAKIERLLRVDPDQVRREGAVLDRQRFDAVVAGVGRIHRT